MSDDVLTKPLGVAPPAKAGKRRLLPFDRLPWGKLIGGACVLTLTGLAAYMTMTSQPLGGEPMAVAAIEKVPRRDTPPLASGLAQQSTAQQLSPNVREVPQQGGVDERSGDRQEAAAMEQGAGVRVMRTGGAQAPGSVVIRVPDAQAVIRLAAAPDRRLTDKGRHGTMPKLGEEGLRPADVYARPVTPAQRAAPAKIAIVIGGLGISANSTTDAIQRLPADISLAFAPYGSDLERHVARARENGHEVLLQAPMEPFDYPDNDPGPHTLVSTLPPEQNMDRLHWVMSRFSGYVGVVNFMGGRFTSTEPVMSPIIREIGQRGLLYMDDGSSGRSLAPQLATVGGVASARTEVVIDVVQRGQEIDAALARLEKIAKEKGVAIGFGSALPVTVERIARWAKAAEGRGIVLVPISSVAVLPKRSS
jgi:uncharacterized protein